jgi:hypothetical protein
MKYFLYLAVLLSCRTDNRTAIPGHRSSYTNSQVQYNRETLETEMNDPLSGKDTVLLNRIVDSIYKFPEVQAIDKQIAKNSKMIHGVSFMVQDGFNGDTSLYQFSVGDNSSSDRYTNIYNFILVKGTLEIKVYEPSNDSIMSLQAWRRRPS